MHVDIRRARPQELTAVVASLGKEWFFRDRLKRQGRGEGELLIAWSATAPVGDIYLWCTPADEPEVRASLPGVPLLNHLEVVEPLRRRGIGTQLVTRAEARLSELAHQRVALGVGLDNTAARLLYEGLGYTDWGHGTVESSWREPTGGGGSRTVTEVLSMLIKDLPRT